MSKQSDTPCPSACAICGKPVETHKYAQIIPLQPTAEETDESIAAKPAAERKRFQKCQASGTWHRVPGADEECRQNGRRFVCLNHEADAAALKLELDPETLYELRHRPPRKVVLLPIADLAELDLATKVGQLTDGRIVHINAVRGGLAEADFGLLQKVRATGANAAAVLTTWQQLLIKQLLG